jgi:hypothetical protein
MEECRSGVAELTGLALLQRNSVPVVALACHSSRGNYFPNHSGRAQDV